MCTLFLDFELYYRLFICTVIMCISKVFAPFAHDTCIRTTYDIMQLGRQLDRRWPWIQAE